MPPPWGPEPGVRGVASLMVAARGSRVRVDKDLALLFDLGAARRRAALVQHQGASLLPGGRKGWVTGTAPPPVPVDLYRFSPCSLLLQLYPTAEPPFPFSPSSPPFPRGSFRAVFAGIFTRGSVDLLAHKSVSTHRQADKYLE